MPPIPRRLGHFRRTNSVRPWQDSKRSFRSAYRCGTIRFLHEPDLSAEAVALLHPLSSFSSVEDRE